MCRPRQNRAGGQAIKNTMKTNHKKIIPEWIQESITNAMERARADILDSLIAPAATLIPGTYNAEWQKPSLGFGRVFETDKLPRFALYLNGDQSLYWSIKDVLQDGASWFNGEEHKFIKDLETLSIELNKFIKAEKRKARRASNDRS